MSDYLILWRISREDSIIEGMWVETVGGGKIYYKEKNRMLWIVCDNTETNRKFFKTYKRKLEVRFRQKTIFMLITVNVSIIQ